MSDENWSLAVKIAIMFVFRRLINIEPLTPPLPAINQKMGHRYPTDGYALFFGTLRTRKSSMKLISAMKDIHCPVDREYYQIQFAKR